MYKFLLFILASLSLTACAKTTPVEVNENLNDVAPYPEAMAGFTRYAINLPSLTNENSAKVELVIGKNMEVDCNIHRYSAKVEQKELKGWGYSYYVMDKVNEGISTLMACPQGESKTQFVQYDDGLGLLPYNSRLPIVIYVPNDVKVDYRIWHQKSKVFHAVAE